MEGATITVALIFSMTFTSLTTSPIHHLTTSPVHQFTSSPRPEWGGAGGGAVTRHDFFAISYSASGSSFVAGVSFLYLFLAKLYLIPTLKFSQPIIIGSFESITPKL